MITDVQPEQLNGVFCDNMKRARARLGITQVDLAERMGVAQSYISDLEAGKKRPLVETLAELAEALETTPAKLITPHSSGKIAS